MGNTMCCATDKKVVVIDAILRKLDSIEKQPVKLSPSTEMRPLHNVNVHCGYRRVGRLYVVRTDYTNIMSQVSDEDNEQLKKLNSCLSRRKKASREIVSFFFSSSFFIVFAELYQN